jgi:hypothetical protein
VATDWAPVIQTGIGAAAALGGGFVGAWWQARAQQRIERDHRRDRAAQATAAAVELLQDLDPYRVVGIGRSSYKAELKALTQRRLDVRGQLWVLAAGHPSADVRDLAIKAAQALGDSLAASTSYVANLEALDEDAVKDAREEAIRWNGIAADYLERLMQAIQDA